MSGTVRLTWDSLNAVPRSQTASDRCELCGRRMQSGTTAHHLIPRTCHSNRWFKQRFTREQMQETVDLCRDCHLAVHRFIPKEKTLGRDYHTLEALRQHEGLANFITWIRRQR